MRKKIIFMSLMLFAFVGTVFAGDFDFCIKEAVDLIENEPADIDTITTGTVENPKTGVFIGVIGL